MIQFFSSKKRFFLTIFAVIILFFLAILWQKEQKAFFPPKENTLVLINWVDRGLSKEAKAELEKRREDLDGSMKSDEKIAKDISKILTLGNLNYSLGELALAKEFYEKILKDYPNDAPSHENLAQTLKEMGDFDGAELHWRKALILNPYDGTYLKLADLIDENFTDRRLEIRTLLEEGISVLGQSPSLLIRLGDWYRQEGDYERAISHYKVALQLDPENMALKTLIEETQAQFKTSKQAL